MQTQVKLEEIRVSPQEERSSRYRIKNGISTFKRCGNWCKDLGMTWRISRLQAETPIFVSVNCTRIYLTNSVLECKYMYHVYWHLYRLSLLCSWALQSSLAAFPTSAAGTRKLEAKSQQQFISWCVLDCKYIRKMQWCVLSVHFFLWLKMPSRELSFWPPPLIFLKMVSFTSLSREV